MMAAAIVQGYASDDDIRAVATTFGGVEHRIEFVREKDGVKYYNDSIASSPTRTIAGLNSFRQKVILIAGGYDKHIPLRCARSADLRPRQAAPAHRRNGSQDPRLRARRRRRASPICEVENLEVAVCRRRPALRLATSLSCPRPALPSTASRTSWSAESCLKTLVNNQKTVAKLTFSPTRCVLTDAEHKSYESSHAETFSLLE